MHGLLSLFQSSTIFPSSNLIFNVLVYTSSIIILCYYCITRATLGVNPRLLAQLDFVLQSDVIVYRPIIVYEPEHLKNNTY